MTAGAALIEQFVKALDCLHICPQRPAQGGVALGNRRLAGVAGGRTGPLINGRAAAVRDAFAGLAEVAA